MMAIRMTQQLIEYIYLRSATGRGDLVPDKIGEKLTFKQ
jgi:hypothetical protein